MPTFSCTIPKIGPGKGHGGERSQGSACGPEAGRDCCAPALPHMATSSGLLALSATQLSGTARTPAVPGGYFVRHRLIEQPEDALIILRSACMVCGISGLKMLHSTPSA